MKFTVYQSFETLGAPETEMFDTPAEAAQAAETLRAEISAMVQTWPIESPSNVGFIPENAAWADACEMDGAEFHDDGQLVGAARCYSRSAADFIAAKAVTCEEVEPDDE